MTDFSDCIDYIDRYKQEMLSRFILMLTAISQLEHRVGELEDQLEEICQDSTGNNRSGEDR